MSHVPRARRCHYHDALQSLYSSILEFEQSFADSPTAAFLKPSRFPSQSQSLRPVPPKALKPLPVRLAAREEHRHKSEPRIRRKPLPQVSRKVEGCRTPLSPLLPKETSPRFPVSFRELIGRYRPSIRKLSPEEMRDLSLRIQDNIDKAKHFTSEFRLQSITARSLQTDQRLKSTREMRLSLAEAKHRLQAAAFSAKQRKFEWRQNAHALSRAQAQWTAVYTSLAVLSAWGRSMAALKALRNRSKRLGIVVFAAAVCVGRVRRRVKRRKWRDALAVLRKLSPYIGIWRRSMRARHSTRLLTFLESAVPTVTLRKLIDRWSHRVRVTQVALIQRSVRGWLQVRTAQKTALLRLWERMETVGLGIVPARVKEAAVRQLIKDKTKKCVRERTEWRKTCGVRHPSGCVWIQPAKPQFHLLLTHSELQFLVQRLSPRGPSA